MRNPACQWTVCDSRHVLIIVGKFVTYHEIGDYNQSFPFLLILLLSEVDIKLHIINCEKIVFC